MNEYVAPELHKTCEFYVCDRKLTCHNVGCSIFHIPFRIRIAPHFKLWRFKPPLTDRRPLQFGLHNISFRCRILGQSQNISVIGWIGALSDIVSLFSTSITYIWIPHLASSRVSFATLLANWIVLKILLLRLIILTPLSRGLFPYS